MTLGEPLPPPGWYPDPYRSDSVRWFDGTVWTTHAVPGGTARPDEMVESTWKGSSPEELREQVRFPGQDLAVPRAGERPDDGGGGWQGLYAIGSGVDRCVLARGWGRSTPLDEGSGSLRCWRCWRGGTSGTGSFWPYWPASA